MNIFQSLNLKNLNKKILNYTLKIKDWIGNNPIIFLVSLLIISLGSFVSLIDNTSKVLDYAGILDRNFLRKHQTAQAEIGKLSLDVHQNYFKSILGEPVFINQTNFKYENCSSSKEYIYIKDLYIVQAITESDKIISSMVTSLDDSFKPFVEFGQINNDNFYNDFFEFNEEDLITSELGSNYFQYAESEYTGNQSLYKVFVKAFNPIGSGSVDYFYEIGTYSFLEGEERENYFNRNKVNFDKFRKNNTYNTAGVFFIDNPPNCFDYSGPEYNQVKLLIGIKIDK